MKDTQKSLKLDDHDLKIINILKNDSRTSLEEISKALDLSKSTIYYRIKRLEEEGVIRKFSIILDNKKLGYTISAVSCAKIKFKEGSVAEIARKISKIPGVESIYSILGEMDFYITIEARDKDELKDIVEKLNSMPEIERTNTYLVINKLKEGTFS